MMSPIHAVFLGLLQGVTEFLPVSSSGHLVIAEHWLGLGSDASMLSFDILLHCSTLLALLVCYPQVWLRMVRIPWTRDPSAIRLAIALIIGTIPGAIAGLLLEDGITQWARSPSVVGILFLCTAVVLVAGERMCGRASLQSVSPLHALWIGCAQACALFPGLSRSGLTISMGRAVGLRRTDALDFSFLLAVPIIAGASIVSLLQVGNGSATLPAAPVVTAGMLASFGASVLCVLGLRRFVAAHSLAWFALYLVPLGCAILLR